MLFNTGSLFPIQHKYLINKHIHRRNQCIPERNPASYLLLSPTQRSGWQAPGRLPRPWWPPSASWFVSHWSWTRSDCSSYTVDPWAGQGHCAPGTSPRSWAGGKGCTEQTRLISPQEPLTWYSSYQRNRKHVGIVFVYDLRHYHV